MRAILPVLLIACGAPERPDEQVGYRDGSDGGASSGERGTVKINELLWSGALHDDGRRDPGDVFVELRNESARPLNLSGWRLVVDGTEEAGWRIPPMDAPVPVDGILLVAARSDGCFPDADVVIPGFSLPDGDAFSLTLLDADERLIETAGRRDEEPFAGGYDGVRSRSMERISLMFGADGDRQQYWHFYAGLPCPSDVIGGDPANVELRCFEGHPHNDRVAADCRHGTLATRGRPNSPDYSGAYASGSFE